MITKTNLKLLRNGEIIKLLSNIVSILKKVSIEALVSIQSQLESEYEALNIAYKMERGNKLTLLLITLDNARDLYFVALRTILGQHAVAHPDMALRDRAQVLLNVMLRHGNMLHRKSYQEQTAGMDHICSAIDADAALQSTMTDLHLMEYYQAMKTSNKDFDTNYLERNSQYAELPEASMSELRDKAEETYTTLVASINAHLVLAEDKAPFEKVAAEINTLLEAYYAVVERRQSGSTDLESTSTDEELNANFGDVTE